MNYFNYSSHSGKRRQNAETSFTLQYSILSNFRNVIRSQIKLDIG